MLPITVENYPNASLNNVEWKSDVLSFSVRYIGRPTAPSSLHKICQMKVKNGPKTGVPESLHSIATKDVATPEIQ